MPPDVLSTVVTHSTVGTRPVRTHTPRPLVLLSPGFGMPRATLTGLAEELASRGHIVAAIGHNHEANGITFPDGHTTSCVICANPDHAKVGAVRAADVSFVLDQLTGTHPVWQYGDLIDTDRIAMIGHSAGGYSTIPALLSDPRLTAAVNMDGNFRYPNDTPLNRPMLILGKPSHVPGGPDPTWDQTWRELTGWKRAPSNLNPLPYRLPGRAPVGDRLRAPSGCCLHINHRHRDRDGSTRSVIGLPFQYRNNCAGAGRGGCRGATSPPQTAWPVTARPHSTAGKQTRPVANAAIASVAIVR